MQSHILLKRTGYSFCLYRIKGITLLFIRCSIYVGYFYRMTVKTEAGSCGVTGG